VDLEVPRAATAWGLAATTVAVPDESPECGRKVLMCTLGRVSVDRPDVLRVAQCLLHRGFVDGDLGAASVLPALLALRAYCHRELEFRAAVLFVLTRRGRERDIAQRGDQLVVVEVTLFLVAKHRAHLAKPRVRIGAELESHHARTNHGIRRVARTASPRVR